jgi:hypothetical protein
MSSGGRIWACRYLLPGDKAEPWSPWQLRCYHETLPVTQEVNSQALATASSLSVQIRDQWDITKRSVYSRKKNVQFSSRYSLLLVHTHARTHTYLYLRKTISSLECYKMKFQQSLNWVRFQASSLIEDYRRFRDTAAPITRAIVPAQHPRTQSSSKFKLTIHYWALL